MQDSSVVLKVREKQKRKMEVIFQLEGIYCPSAAHLHFSNAFLLLFYHLEKELKVIVFLLPN